MASDEVKSSSGTGTWAITIVMGQGFRAVVKPEAFAASHAADHAVKHRNEGRKAHAQRRGGRAA